MSDIGPILALLSPSSPGRVESRSPRSQAQDAPFPVRPEDQRGRCGPRQRTARIVQLIRCVRNDKQPLPSPKCPNVQRKWTPSELGHTSGQRHQDCRQANNKVLRISARTILLRLRPRILRTYLEEPPKDAYSPSQPALRPARLVPRYRPPLHVPLDSPDHASWDGYSFTCYLTERASGMSSRSSSTPRSSNPALHCSLFYHGHGVGDGPKSTGRSGKSPLVRPIAWTGRGNGKINYVREPIPEVQAT